MERLIVSIRVSNTYAWMRFLNYIFLILSVGKAERLYRVFVWTVIQRRFAT